MNPSSRRHFLRKAAGAAIALTGARALGQTAPIPSSTSPASQAAAPSSSPASAPTSGPARIDRHALVTRHNIRFDHVDPANPLQVGNGEFAFGIDVTGLQTLADAYRPRMGLNTMAQWAWHREPSAEQPDIESLTHAYDVGGRTVPYIHDADFSGAPAPLGTWLRSNPHRFSLARIALVSTGVAIKPEDLSEVDQTLDLWTGIVSSRFNYKGKRVQVTTAAHPSLDLLAFEITAPELFASGDLAVQLSFPAARADWKNPDDWNHPEAHTTTLRSTENGAQFDRKQDETAYVARAAWQGQASLAQSGPHAFELTATGERVGLIVEFAPRPFDAPAITAAEVFAASRSHWEKFWNEGACIDFSACTDPRAAELERRVILSQYLTAIHSAGSMPPQDAGLVCNSWFGKMHLDMHPWQAAHFAMWNRFGLLERSLKFYEATLPHAQEQAKRQGYAGARWPKTTDRQGATTPSEIDAFVVWQQPHPIYFAELAYRAAPTRETLERHATLVEASAHFMAGYARYDEATKRYVLGPALVPAQESYWEARGTTINPTFELAYWAWALGVAQKWRERLGQPREAHWADVIEKLSKPTIRDGRYSAIETEPFLENADHPSFLMALGFVPKTHLIDDDTMRETARWTKAKWKWNTAWGWDFAVLALTATRLGEAELAIDSLSIESVKNTFTANGHNFQTEQLPAYLPGNGALLAAIALMAGGWDGGPDTPAPGFPKNGRWDVKVEGFEKVI